MMLLGHDAFYETSHMEWMCVRDTGGCPSGGGGCGRTSIFSTASSKIPTTRRSPSQAEGATEPVGYPGRGHAIECRRLVHDILLHSWRRNPPSSTL